MTKPDGGPAFPQGKDQGASDAGFPIVEITGGMTVRDVFAAAALQGLLSGDLNPYNETHADAALLSYRYADAMLAEREK